MVVKSNRKELVSVGLEPQDAEVLRKYAETKDRSFSETIRIIVKEFVIQRKLHQQFKK